MEDSALALNGVKTAIYLSNERRTVCQRLNKIKLLKTNWECHILQIAAAHSENIILIN